MKKEERLLKVLNEMIKNSEPIRYMYFNAFIKAKTTRGLLKAEKKYKELGLTNSKTEIRINGKLDWKYDGEKLGISVLSIMATITDVLIEKRLGFTVETEGKMAGYITKAYFYDYTKKNKKKK